MSIEIWWLWWRSNCLGTRRSIHSLTIFQVCLESLVRWKAHVESNPNYSTLTRTLCFRILRSSILFIVQPYIPYTIIAPPQYLNVDFVLFMKTSGYCLFIVWRFFVKYPIFTFVVKNNIFQIRKVHIFVPFCISQSFLIYRVFGRFYLEVDASYFLFL